MNAIALIVFSAKPHFDSAQCSSATATVKSGFGMTGHQPCLLREKRILRKVRAKADMLTG
jgi:hypothetical protein